MGIRKIGDLTCTESLALNINKKFPFTRLAIREHFLDRESLRSYTRNGKIHKNPNSSANLAKFLHAQDH